MNVEGILQAMRAECVQAGAAGRWTVEKGKFNAAMSEFTRRDGGPFVPPGNYTYLYCLTFETMMKPPGVVVMNDFPSELRKHLEFIMTARGRVLVTGLGLGCVVRGLLARGAVESIDLIERSWDVIKLCGKSVEDPRVTIHHRDALKGFVHGKWDYAWHDIWDDPEAGDNRHLQVLHSNLIAQYAPRVKRQGAWNMPRWFFRRGNFGLKRTKR